MQSTLAFDTSVKGFIALDLPNFEKIEGDKASTILGIGVLDLKVFAEQDAMTLNMKIDLDGKLSENYNLFEEAYVGYRGIRDFRFMAGKGVIRFQNIHWGAAVNSYQDGGSVLDTEQSYRKLSRKAFTAVSYGHRSRGFLNTFSFFGNSQDVKTDDNKDPIYDVGTSGNGSNPYYVKGFTYDQVKAFDTSKQMGLANKFELYVNDEMTFTQGLLVQRNRFTGKSSWAVAASFRIEKGEYEFWTEAVYGYTTTNPYEKYATYRKTESYLQVGSEYFLNELWSIVGNVEGIYVEDRAHTYNDFIYRGKTAKVDSSIRKQRSLYQTLQYKVESGIKYKLSKSAHLTFAGLWENKIVEKDHVKNLTRIDGINNPNRQAFKVINSISYWF